jgi:hypothetical protein
MSNGLNVNKNKGIYKSRWTSTQKHMEYDSINEDEVTQMQSMFMLKREKNMVTSKGCNIAHERNAYE